MRTTASALATAQQGVRVSYHFFRVAGTNRDKRRPERLHACVGLFVVRPGYLRLATRCLTSVTSVDYHNLSHRRSRVSATMGRLLGDFLTFCDFMHAGWPGPGKHQVVCAASTTRITHLHAPASNGILPSAPGTRPLVRVQPHSLLQPQFLLMVLFSPTPLLLAYRRISESLSCTWSPMPTMNKCHIEEPQLFVDSLCVLAAKHIAFCSFPSCSSLCSHLLRILRYQKFCWNDGDICPAMINATALQIYSGYRLPASIILLRIMYAISCRYEPDTNTAYDLDKLDHLLLGVSVDSTGMHADPSALQL